MPTELSRAIDAVSDPATPLPAALRRVLIVARRIGSPDLSIWVTKELNGYRSLDDEVPSYRSYAGTGYDLRFAGPFHSSYTCHIAESDLPEQLQLSQDRLRVRQPVAELVALAEGDGDPATQMSAAWVGAFRQFANEGKTIHMEMMELERASRPLPRTMINGILDQIRTSALDLLLDLEGVDPAAGSVAGPTVETNQELSSVVQNFNYNIYGDGAQVNHVDRSHAAIATSGSATQLTEGDAAGLVELAKSYLEPPGVEALEQALAEDGGQPGQNTRSFLDRVKSDTFKLVAGISTNAAYDALVAGVHQVAPYVS